MPRLWALAVLCAALALPQRAAAAGSIALVDGEEVFPQLRVADDLQRALRWDGALGVQTLTACSGVRITRRGVRCIPPGWALAMQNMSTVAFDNGKQQWVANACPALAQGSALCAFESKHYNATYASRVFPVEGAAMHESAVFTGEPDARAGDSEMRAVHTLETLRDDAGALAISDILRQRPCRHGRGREVLPQPGARYDVTACDVFDGNADFVYVPATQQLYVRLLELELVSYGITSCLVLVLTVFIAEELSNELMNQRDGKHAPSKFRMALMLCSWSATLCLALVLQFGSHRAHAMVTVEDQYCFWGMFAYIMVYTLLWGVDTACTLLGVGDTNRMLITSTGHSRNHGINCMLASTFFAVFVLVGSPENIYSQPFFFVFIYRMLYKTYCVLQDGTTFIDGTCETGEAFYVVDRFTLLCDVVFVAHFFKFCVVPMYTHFADALLRVCGFALLANVVALSVARGGMAKQQV